MIKNRNDNLDIIITNDNISIDVYKLVYGNDAVDITPIRDIITIDTNLYKQSLTLPNEDCVVIVKVGTKYSIVKVGVDIGEIFYPYHLENQDINYKRYSTDGVKLEDKSMTYRGYNIYSVYPNSIEDSIIKIDNSLEYKYISPISASGGTLILNKNTWNLVAINVEDMRISSFIDAVGAENIDIANAFNNGSYLNFKVGQTDANSTNDFFVTRTDGDVTEIQPFFIKVKDIPNDITYEWGS